MEQRVTGEREPRPPLPEFARGDWNQTSDVLSFTEGGFGIVPHGGGPTKFTRETFIRGAASMLYGERADAIVEHWRALNEKEAASGEA